MKRIKKIMAGVFLFASLFCPVTSHAVGDGNIDNGGIGLGSGSSTNFWSVKDEGVRVTVINALDGGAVTTPFDLTNVTPDNIVVHFGKVSKSHYRDGAELTPDTESYLYVNPAQAMPKIITDTPGNVSLEVIKAYFTDEQVIRSIAGIVGMDYGVLTGGEYKILLEPVAYVTYEGVRTAFTATEGSLYNRATGGMVRKRLTDLTHRNLPLAMFLEFSDAGYEVWTGGTGSRVDDDSIGKYLGLGIVRFTGTAPVTPPAAEENPPAPDKTPPPNVVRPPVTDDEPEAAPPKTEIQAPDYVYRTDTDVYTAVTVSGGQADPDSPVKVTFSLPDRNITVTNIYYPEDGQQLVWVRWHTPSVPQRVTIGVTSSRGDLSKTTINADIVDMNENPPPNPTANDRNDGYNAALAVAPAKSTGSSASWSVWKPWWREHWIWHEDWKWYRSEHSSLCDRDCGIQHGRWIDEGEYRDDGWWEFDLEYHTACITGSMTLGTDQASPTSDNKTLKSGYGINIYAEAVSGGDPEVTAPQTAVTYFPEFYYKTYFRCLEVQGNGRRTGFVFRKNEYSTYRNRTHFTPVWMPDGSYTVFTHVSDCWTPAGMLSLNLTDSLTIRGNLWEDWHIAPERAGG